MPRYYFNVHSDHSSLDYAGHELPDDGAAVAEALNSARALAAEHEKDGHLYLGYRIDVEDEQRQCVVTVAYTDAVLIGP